jgi:hypothetical protein
LTDTPTFFPVPPSEVSPTLFPGVNEFGMIESATVIFTTIPRPKIFYPFLGKESKSDKTLPTQFHTLA